MGGPGIRFTRQVRPDKYPPVTVMRRSVPGPYWSPLLGRAGTDREIPDADTVALPAVEQRPDMPSPDVFSTATAGAMLEVATNADRQSHGR